MANGKSNRITCETCSGAGVITVGDTDVRCYNCDGHGSLLDIDCLDSSIRLPETDAAWGPN